MDNKSSSQNVIIRPLHPRDAADQYEMVAHPAVARMLLQLPSMELAQTEEWVQKSQPGRHRLVAEVGGKVVGSGSLTQAQRPRLAHCGRLGMMVHPHWWGQGIGSQLMEALLELADGWLNLRRVELEVFTDNTAAIHLYQKFGFRVEGRRRKVAFGDGQWLDDLVMARLRRPVESASPPPTAEGRPSTLPSLVKSVTVRPLRPDDANPLYELFRHPLVARTTLQMPSQELSKTMERVSSRPQGLHRLVAADEEGRVLGIITLHQSQNPRLVHSAGLGMMVHPGYWGQGIGSQLMAAILEVADDWLNLKRVELEVNVDNPAGVGLYRKFGFVIEGTKRMHTYGDGRWADSYFMARVLLHKSPPRF